MLFVSRSKSLLNLNILVIFLSLGFLVSSSAFGEKKDLEDKGSSTISGSEDKPGYKLLDRVLATVNGDAVFYHEVQDKLKTSNIVLFSSYPAGESASDYEKALNDEINIKLVTQAAKGLGIDDEGDVDQKIADFLSSNHLTKKELLKELESQGISFEKYRKDFQDQMILKDFQSRVIYPMVKMTDKDLEAYYLRKTSKNDRSNLKYDLRMIFIKDGKDAKEKTQVVVGELKSGKTFEEVVRLYSDDSSTRKEGGLISGIYLRDLSVDIAGVVKDMKPSTYSTPVKSSDGYYIVYLVSTSLGEDKNFNSSKQKLQAEYSQELYQRQLTSWLESQRRKSQIVINK